MDFLRGWPRNPDDGMGRRAGVGRAPRAGAGVVLTVGSFDGLHRGHQALIRQARAIADARGLPLGTLFFEPTAREYFSPATAPPRVLPLPAKLLRLAELGVDTAWCLRFGRELAGMEAAEFARRLAGVGVRVVVAGDDFRFGRGRTGDARLLEQVGIETVTVPVVAVELPGSAATAPYPATTPVRCSSTCLREMLGRGDMVQAEAVLGAPYRLVGRVRRGRQLGRTLGCPTANMVFRRRLALAHGVYAGTARVAACGVPAVAAREDVEYPAVASFGVRPTLEGGLAPWLEVHLLDASRDLYGRYLDFRPRHFLRPEARFDSLDTLRRAIADDMSAARDWLAAHGVAPVPTPPSIPTAAFPAADALPSPAAGRVPASRLATIP